MSEMSFSGQRENEVVKTVFRRHVMTTAKTWWWLIILGVLGFVPMLIWRDVSWLFWVWIGCLVLGGLIVIYEHILWHFSIYILTNQRIRQISQKGLFRKTVLDLGLDKIQSVSYSIPGMWAGMFGYGRLLIQTQVGDMVISMVPKPEKIYNMIQDLLGEIDGE